MYSAYLCHTAQVCFWGAGVSCPCTRLHLATKKKVKPRKDGSQWKRRTPAHRLRDKELRILEVNIRGLRSNIGELANLCKDQEPTIVIIVETFLDSTVQDGADSIAIPGYTMCCRQDRTEKSKGGIAVYCLEGVAIHHDPLRDPEDLEMLWFSITLQSQKLLVGAIYKPPNANNDVIDYLDSNTLLKMDEFGAHSVMLIGDFNIHHEEWLGSHNTDAAGRKTLEVANCLGLEQIVKEPTREDQILDLALTDLPASSTTFAKLGTSDHNPVLVKLDVPAFRDKPYRRKVWHYPR